LEGAVFGFRLGLDQEPFLMIAAGALMMLAAASFTV
jgi:hypothetical protein